MKIEHIIHVEPRDHASSKARSRKLSEKDQGQEIAVVLRGVAPLQPLSSSVSLTTTRLRGVLHALLWPVMSSFRQNEAARFFIGFTGAMRIAYP
jgi:hypothetical protein